MLTGGTYIFRFSFLIDSDIKRRTKKYKSLCCPRDSNAEPKSDLDIKDDLSANMRAVEENRLVLVSGRIKWAINKKYA